MNCDKYRIEGDTLVNVDTGKAIPSHEPIFILRANDAYALRTITRYADDCRNCVDDFRINLREIIGKFNEWRTDHPEKVKVPN